MPTEREKFIERAKSASRESKILDFKREFDPTSASAWRELVKDVVAFANSGGGAIVIGVEDNGSPSSFVPEALLKFDTANFTTQVAKYTGHQFAEIELVEIDRSGHRCAVLLVGSTDVPLVFIRPGTYEITVPGGKQQQKTAFGLGTIYFRHNSKSEPGNRDDLSAWRDAEIERHRKAWLGGIRKVVATSAHETISVVSSNAPPNGSVVAAVATNDPKAVHFFPKNAGEIWPLRQKDLISAVNRRLPVGHKITSHDVTCLKAKFDLIEKHPEMVCKPHKLASPQYSNSFVDWIIEAFEKDNSLFQSAREHYKSAH